MHQIPDGELMAVMLIIASALRLCRFWSSHLPLQESFNCRAHIALVRRGKTDNPNGNRALAQELADRGELR
jgi:hypothetical protein